MSTNLQLHIEGMTCTSCAAAVEKALRKVPTVETAQVSFTGKKALLEVQEDDIGAIRGALEKAVRDAGYEVVDPAEKRAQAEEHVRKERNRLIWSWVLTAPLMALMLLHMIWGIHLFPGIAGDIGRLVVAATVIFGIGFPVIRSTLHSFRTMVFTMDSLIGIGSIAAFATGILRLGGVGIGDFTSVGAMIVAINYIGSYIKVRATGRAGSAIRELLELGAKRATRLERNGPDSDRRPDGDGGETDAGSGSEADLDNAGVTETIVAVTELRPGDVVRVRPGEKIPADGTILRGSTSIDESIVTGESVPVDKEPGTPVVGGTINQMGTIDVRVDKTGEETFLAQIVGLVEEAQASRVPVQELADRVTAIFVPAILVLSVATFAGWILVTNASGTPDVTAALSAAIATLVIACPCALGLATPTALMVGMGYGAERGVLVRNGEAIQIARELDTVVFDKTGTLTIGRPEVRAAANAAGSPPGQDDLDALTATLAVERESEHPLARALTGYLEEAIAAARTGAPAGLKDDTNPADGTPAAAPGQVTVTDPAGKPARSPSNQWNLDDTRAVPGHGIIGRTGDTVIRVGSVRWLRSEGIATTPEQERVIEAWRDAGMTIVGTAIGPAGSDSAGPSGGDAAPTTAVPAPAPTLAALFALADAIKPDAPRAIAALHAQGLRTAILTGDGEAAAQAIAREAGIDEVFAELRPEQKIDAVRSLQKEGRKVAMVGDGINDAPALKQAHVGIAVGTGTDIAIESADITLMSSSLGMIPQAIDLSRKTFRKIRTNLFWAFFYNLIAIPLAVAGLLHPVIAEVAMAFSSITVVSNSLHLKRILRRSVGAPDDEAQATHRQSTGRPAVHPAAETHRSWHEAREEQMGLFGSNGKVSYHIADMNCGHCEAKVTAALSELPAVKKVKATAKDKTVVIEYTGDTAPDLATVNSVLEPAGYPATQV
ncbi:MAG: heavy metal translocating P-type ATPase [Alkalispirochaeta sp.]